MGAVWSGCKRRLLESVHRRLGRQVFYFEQLPKLGTERCRPGRPVGPNGLLFGQPKHGRRYPDFRRRQGGCRAGGRRAGFCRPLGDRGRVCRPRWNVYKRDQASGQWSRNNGGSWEAMNSPAPGGGQGSRNGQFQAERQAPGTQTPSSPAGNREAIQNDLNRDASARNQGNFEARRSEEARKGSGWTSGGWTGPRSSGWSTRSPSFGRRR